jgi:hypothetical protein
MGEENTFGDFLGAVADMASTDEPVDETPPEDRLGGPLADIPPKLQKTSKPKKRGNQHQDVWGPEQDDLVVELVVRRPKGATGSIMPWVQRQEMIQRSIR